MADNILQRAIRKIRPGSGGPAHAISIVDGQTGSAPTFAPGIRSREETDEDFDDQKSGMPLALASGANLGAPTGILPGVGEDGNIPYYEPDDSAVLARLFGLRGVGLD